MMVVECKSGTGKSINKAKTQLQSIFPILEDLPKSPARRMFGNSRCDILERRGNQKQ